ncbi:roquin-1-like isoform X4 [Erpetoichthys calabaricus]|uniref:roquin-1-like isoform X4 n=1 Tax=Erpetoichthys calabaricus TaxID=27687 RepID=UPI0022344E05|nr:roquin-1-like isoform X4 [Erpetoichthys calabaricus]
MPVQAPQWTEFLLCPICTQTFEETIRKPISLGCGHTVCKMCLNKLHRKACPFDQTTINTDIEQLPVNSALLQLVGGQVPKQQVITLLTGAEDTKHYEEARKCVEELALYLKPLSSTRGVGLNSTTQSVLSRPMQRKLVTLVHCQLVEEEGRIRAMRAARSLGERTVTELILQHQNPQQLSSNLWAAVRARGCQFLGPAMQEEALKLVLLALEDGSALSRKVLVLFVVQRLEPRFPQASKTSIGHVVQLLYRASCFKVTKRDEDSSLMQLKEEFRTYEALRREHDSQIVQIAMEGGLRIAPDQWSSLLYGDQSHKSHMQSIIDKLQTPASFAQSVQELTIALQRTGDPANLNRLRPHLELLANIDPSPDAPPPLWEQLEKGLVAVKTVVHGLVDFIQNHSKKGADQQQPPQHSKYKTYMCRDMKQKGGCPRGASCTFAHSQEELEKLDPLPKGSLSAVPISTHSMSQARIAPEHSAMSKQVQMVARGSQHYAQQAEMYYPEHRPPALPSPYEHSPYQPGVPYPYPSSQYVQPRYARSGTSEQNMQYTDPYVGPYLPDRQYPGQPTQYPPMAQPVYSPAHEMRRTFPQPASFQREEIVRMSPVPVEVPAPAAVSPYLSEARERYPPEGYCPVGPHPSQMRSYPRDSYGRVSHVQPSLDDLHRRRKEIMAQLEERKVISPPPFAPSPTLPHAFPQDYPQEYLEEKAHAKFKDMDYTSQYSPWSCDTIGSYISTKDVKAKDVMASGSVEMMNVDSKALWDQPIDLQRRSADVKDDDPIIPFGALPTVSRFGVISRTPRTAFQTTGPVQALASSQGATTKHISVSADYPAYGPHAGWGPTSYPPHQNVNSQGHFSDRLPRPPPDREQLKMELQQVNQQINQQTQIRGLEAANNALLLQREASAMATQPHPAKWAPGPLSSEQLSLELHQVEREIGKRTREIAMESQTSHEMQFKMKGVENGQPEHKTTMEDIGLSGSEGPNGSALMPDGGLTSLTAKTASMSLSADAGGGVELQKNGILHPCP